LIGDLRFNIYLLMKFVDDSQNLRLRLRLIQTVILLLLSVLAVRLYVLQVVNGAKYAEVAENQRIRLLPIPAPRGDILDRDLHVLVNSAPIYSVLLSREDTKGIDRNSLIEPLATALDLDPQLLRERFEQVKSQPAFESILIKEGATQSDIAWVDAHQLEYPALRVEQIPQRRYPANGSLAHVLGYVQEISPEQLEDPRYKERKYKPGDVIGQDGVEAVYDE
jgi:penicillin-binding protein 2